MGWFLISQICTKVQRGFQLSWKYFGDVPIIDEESERLEELVDEMIALQERRQDGEDVEEEIEEVNEKIDEEVFDLYGLNEGERELVQEEVE